MGIFDSIGKSFKSLGQKKYYSCCKYANFMIGNSSSGIVESASFKLPVVNLGNRQDGKIMLKNITNTDFTETKILKAILECSSEKFRLSLKKLKNCYESKNNIKNICNFILKKSSQKKVLLKKFI